MTTYNAKTAYLLVFCSLITNVLAVNAETLKMDVVNYRKTARFVTAKQKREGGGFMVRRALGAQIDNIDPFLMLDHLGPVNYGPGEAIGAPDHPHRGFETVTYIIDGTVLYYILIFEVPCLFSMLSFGYTAIL